MCLEMKKRTSKLLIVQRRNQKRNLNSLELDNSENSMYQILWMHLKQYFEENT